METQKLDYVQWLVLILTPVLLWGVYWYVGFNQIIVKYILFITAIILLFVNLQPLLISYKKHNSYDSFIAIIMALILFSYFIALFYWGQSPSLTFRASATQFLILYYYILKKFHVGYEDLCRLVTIFAISYIVLWLIAVAAAPRVLFGNFEEINDNRGFYRIVQLKGFDTVCLMFFLLLVRAREKSIKKWIYIVFSVICYLVVFFSLSRNIIFSLSLVTLAFLFKYNRKVLVVLSFFLLFGGYSFLRNNEIVDSLFTLTEQHIEEKSESNLRFVEYSQFYKVYPFRIGTTLFGNGEPHVASGYGIREERLKDTIGFNRSDAGYVHLFTTYGLAMFLLFVLLFFKVLKQKVSLKFLGYKLFLYFLFLVNIMTSVFFSYSLSLVMCLYALEMEREEPYIKNKSSLLVENNKK